MSPMMVVMLVTVEHDGGGGDGNVSSTLTVGGSHLWHTLQKPLLRPLAPSTTTHSRLHRGQYDRLQSVVVTLGLVTIGIDTRKKSTLYRCYRCKTMSDRARVANDNVVPSLPNTNARGTSNTRRMKRTGEWGIRWTARRTRCIDR